MKQLKCGLKFSVKPIQVFEGRVFLPLLSHLKVCVKNNFELSNSKNEDVERAKNYKKKTLNKMIEDSIHSISIDDIDRYLKLRASAIKSINSDSIEIADSNVNQHIKEIAKYCYGSLLTNSTFMKKFGCTIAEMKDSISSNTRMPKCPYCDLIPLLGSGNVKLDHYFPKDKYPELSVHFRNLVPSCGGCNEGAKGVSIFMPMPNLYIEDAWDKIEIDIIKDEFKPKSHDEKTNNYLKTINLKKRINIKSIKMLLLQESKLMYGRIQRANDGGEQFSITEFQEQIGYRLVKSILKIA